MVKVRSGIEIAGTAWDRMTFYVEEFLCETCKFRVKIRYLIIDFGGAFGSRYFPKLEEGKLEEGKNHVRKTSEIS
jgi:hypothetical protein